MVVLQRFVLDNWTAKKLEIDLTFNVDEDFDFEKLKSKGPQPDEKLMPSLEEPDMVEPDIDMNSVNQLLQLGMTQNQAKHCIFNSGGDLEMAQAYFFENIENPAIQMPLLVPNPKKKADGAKSGFKADPESVMMIESMGFSAKQAERALRKCDGNLERACDWIFSHLDEPASDEEMVVDQDNS